MKALAVRPGDRTVSILDVPAPGPLGPSGVLARVLSVGVCGTDREIASFLYGEVPEGSPHIVLGHECLAEVVETGPDVTGLATGDLVVPMVRRPCARLWCRPCHDGRQDFCTSGDFTERGIKGLHGFMAGLVADEERYFVKVPASLRDVGVLVEPLTIAEKGAAQAAILLGRVPGELARSTGFQRAVVLGAGPVGLLGAMKLVALGWETWVYSKGEAGSPNAEVVTAMGARFVSSDRHAGGPGGDGRRHFPRLRGDGRGAGLVRGDERPRDERRLHLHRRAGPTGAARDRREPHHAQPRPQEPGRRRHGQRGPLRLRSRRRGPRRLRRAFPSRRSTPS
ncbi:MAG: alcohol dehydrogenase catalytic domain-containing protein [Holophagales bacterium]|nr:alcohol dehydrogenase catalytic domain-containing protein [Holophagales bacterium]